MQSISSFDDPNVAIWPIENFTEHYEQSMAGDVLMSDLFAFKHPQFRNFGFYLEFKPKTVVESSSLSICLISSKVDFEFSMECTAWLETSDKKRSESKRSTLKFTHVVRNLGWSSFLSSTQMSEFSHLSTVFACFRLPFPVKLVGSISTKSTLYRWLISDFESRSMAAQFQTQWKSASFTVPEFNGVEFELLFYPKGENVQRKDHCACFLNVRSLAGYSKLPIHFDLWIERSESRLHKLGFNYVFLRSSNYGDVEYATQEELCKFAQNGPFNICCEIRPIVDPIRLPDCISFHNEMSSLFNDPYFSDAEVHVGDRVFKISRAIVACKSPVFRAIFDKETEEQKSGVVKIKGFEAAMVEKMLVYIYKHEVVNLKGVAFQLLPLADCYQVNSLVKKCSDSILANLTVDNVLATLELSFEREHLKEFKDQVLKFAHENWNEMQKLPNYKQLLIQVPEIAIELLSIAHA
ncbi:TD and POZ domain-containing protein 5-like protein [Aphelenchoides besseyi]|nr:TD and POZ domain-containing protein 5-like protein [Aphelenchoides besseyi]